MDFTFIFFGRCGLISADYFAVFVKEDKTFFRLYVFEEKVLFAVILHDFFGLRGAFSDFEAGNAGEEMDTIVVKIYFGE